MLLTPTRARRLAPWVLFLLTAAVFSGTAAGGFFWDDLPNLVDNSGFRGFDGAHLRWMLTATWLGHYTPLVWLSFAADHAIWGMEPAGYHLTNILLHGLNAVLVYFLARRLLSIARPQSSETDLTLASGFAALLFSLHPLRVESVAWITERRDVLSSAFLFGSLLAYLDARLNKELGYARRLTTALLLYEASLLSKESGVTLAAVLLILDIYPLRRLGGAAGWTGLKARRVYFEKALFLIAALPTLVLTPLRVYRSGSIVTMGAMGPWRRLGVFCYGLAFYARKTLWPSQLAPFYPLPRSAQEAFPLFAVSAAFVLAAAAAAFFARRKVPAFAAAAACYALILTPVAGLVQNGPQIAADRYSYVSCLPWALLAAGAFLTLLERPSLRPASRAVLLLAACCLCAALAAATAAQAELWGEPSQLWLRTTSNSPTAPLPHVYLAQEWVRHGKDVLAEKEFDAAVAADPLSATAIESRAAFYYKVGRREEASQQLRRALEVKGDLAEPHRLLGHVLEDGGRMEEASKEYALAFKIAPDDAHAALDLGSALLETGRFEAAAAVLSRAASLDPGSAHARYDLALALADSGRNAEALEAYAHTLRLAPDYVEARVNFGNLLAGSGRPEEALAQYRQALALEPGSASAHYNLGALFEALGRRDEARREYDACLVARPGDALASQGLARLNKGGREKLSRPPH